MPSPDRHLAVIMFTDIVGYTALMNRDEHEALTLLEKNRAIHKSCIEKFGGEWLKEMGDGVLVSFTNTYDAALCAGAIQREAIRQEYEMRIGLHEGEVIRQDNDIFGDGVNIASRIESLAEPGQIVVTESIHRNVFNKSGVDTRFLGEKHLKHVSEPWRVYALSVDDEVLDAHMAEQTDPASVVQEQHRSTIHKGLVRWMVIGFVGAAAGVALWMSLSSGEKVEGLDSSAVKSLREKTVAVLPFEGPASGGLAEFGQMAPFWITRRLVDVTDGKVVDVGEATTYEEIPEDVIQRTGLDAVIVGRYFTPDASNGKLEMFVEVIDLKTNETQSLGNYTGVVSDPSRVLDEATQRIMAIWALGDRKRWSQAPPRYDAFSKYQEATKVFNSDLDDAHAMSIEHLVKAYEMDTTFYEPLLKMCSAYNNMGQRAKTDSLLRWIRSRNPTLDPWTEMRMEWHEARFRGGFSRQWAETAYRLAAYDRMDGISQYNAMMSATRVGDYLRALDYFAWYRQLFGLNGCNHGSWPRQKQFMAFFNLGEYAQIIDTLHSLQCIPDDGWLRAYPLKASIRLDRYHLVDSLLAMYRADVHGMEESQRGFLLEAVAKELYAVGEERSEDMASLASLLSNDKTGYEHWGHVFSGNALPAIQKFEQRVQANPADLFYLGHLAFMYFYHGDTTKVRQMYDVLKARPEVPYNPGLQQYYLGLLQALLGNREQAMQHLRKAAEEGYRCDWHTFADDFRLRAMFDYPPFQELVKPRG